MNYFNYTSNRSSYEQLENHNDDEYNDDDDDDGSSSTSSSASSCHSKDKKQYQSHHHHHHHHNRNNNVSMSEHQSVSPSCKRRRWYRRLRRGHRQGWNYIVAAIVFLGSVVIVVRRHSSSSSTTTNKPAEVVTIISHKERLPTFFSIHDGDDYLYALDNPLYIALETATFHNNNNDNVKITISPSRIKCHDESLRVTFFWNETAVHDDDVLVFLCGDNKNKLVTSSSNSSGGHPRGVQQYSDIIEAATMAQIQTTHQLNIQQVQKFGFVLDLGQEVVAANKNNVSPLVSNNHNEWFIPYLPMIRQPVCHFVLYRPRQQQQQRYSNNDDNDENSPVFATDYDLITSSNLLYITSVLEPSMIHLAGTANPTEMVVSFTTGGGSSGGRPVKDNMQQQQKAGSVYTTGKITPLAVYSRVNDNDNIMTMMTTTTTPSRTVVPNDNAYVQSLQQDDDKDDEPRRVTGTTTSYTANDLCSAPGNITAPGKFMSPGLLHTVTMQNLIPNALYQYRVGIQSDDITYWSDYFVFQAPPPPLPLDNDDTENNTVDFFEPFAYLVYGDQGCPREGWGQGAAWTASMVAREVLNIKQQQQQHDDNQVLLPLRAVHHFGDLSYAQGNAHQWDEWFQMIQPMAARVPLHVAVGNHEYDYREGGGLGKDPSLVAYNNAAYATSQYADGHGFHPDWGDYNNDSGGECGVPTSKRFTMPSSSMTTSNGVFWYSHIFASVHTIVLSSEHDLDYGSPQHAWLVQELSVAVNRTRTPWLVVEMHRPLYEGEAKWPENNVGITHRQELEDLFLDYNVDVVFAGHYHAYHRACDGLYQSVCNQGGPLHLTLGTAGGLLDVETVYKNDWSVVLLENEYGYGRVSVHNRTTMHIEFVRAGALDDPRSGQVLDDVWVQRER